MPSIEELQALLTKLLPILEMETMEDEAMEHRNGTHL
jgi:hypothetical protein